MATIISTKTSGVGGLEVTGDATGILQLASNNGTTAVTVDASQNVGIGTASPAYQLHISGTAPRIEMTDTDTGASSYVSASSGTGALVLAADENNVSSGTAMAFRVDASERMRINSSGNVGIGTSSPTQKLEVNGGGLFKTGTDDYVHLLSDSGAIEIVRSVGDAYIDLKNTTSDDYDARIQSSGTSGILSFLTAGAERGNFDSSGNFKFNSGYGIVATAYGCRAWVNFNTITSTTIRGSGNVSTLTDNGTGDTTITFINAMPDANYAATFGIDNGNTSGMGMMNFDVDAAAPTASAVRIQTTNNNTTPAVIDSAWNSVAIFR